ncbi:actin [[Candida] railenensis]|uniref:Centractin n=1 Tax=[Candida] railenensis TaxID=45579 RepID=A0A9P0VYW5_9ASCO|nr:actin [[Candida] railenensis]
MDDTLYNQPVVIDNGSGNLKAGFAGEEKPKSYGSSIVGRPKYQKVMVGSTITDSSGHEDIFIGNSAQNNRGLLKLKYPVEHGIVTDWADMERVWYHTYQQDLKTQSEDHPLLITEAPFNPRRNRDKMCQVLFESFNVPCLYISIQAVLSLYASGRTTGVVVDSGDGVTHIVPVYDGFSLPNSMKRLDVAGRDITENLALQIRKSSGVRLTSSSELEIARLIKEKCCYISKDIDRDEKMYSSIDGGSGSSRYESYRLPDGHLMQVGMEKFRAPEILFNPELIGEESPGVHHLTSLAIGKTDLDLRPVLYKNVILSGGNTLLKGFGDRMLQELKTIQESSTTTNSKLKVKIYAPPERKYSTWIGGSILAGLSTFKKMWVTSGEYQENPDIVHKRYL